MSDTHTPGICRSRCNPISGTWFVRDEDNRVVVATGLTKEGAECISMRINAHDALVEALKKAQDGIGRMLAGQPLDYALLLAEIRVALAATGEKS